MARQKKEQGAQFVRYFGPLLDALRKLGGSGTPDEVVERIAQDLALSDEVQNELLPSGHGTLQINPLVSFKVLFPCKRYAKSVTPSHVRDFRGAMAGRADKGIFITTGTFTAEACREASRDGVPPIELIDGEKLVDMLQRLELGLRPVTTYELDTLFFNEFRG